MSIPISALGGYSLVLRSPRWTEENAKAEGAKHHAIFTTDRSGFSPEFFSRSGGDIWFGGLNDSSLPLPVDAGKLEPDAKSIERLLESAKKLLGLPDQDSDLEVVREGLCYRPISESGTPYIGRIADERLGGGLKTRAAGEGGVFVSAGHGPWGITMSLGTGKVLSALIDGVDTSCDVSSLSL